MTASPPSCALDGVLYRKKLVAKLIRQVEKTRRKRPMGLLQAQALAQAQAQAQAQVQVQGAVMWEVCSTVPLLAAYRVLAVAAAVAAAAAVA